MTKTAGHCPARLVHKTLAQWLHIQPRTKKLVPIGWRVRDKPQANPLVVNLEHLYADLGVLAYTGLDHTQIRKLGDILKWVVDLGGPGRLINVLSRKRMHGRRCRLPIPMREGEPYQAGPLTAEVSCAPLGVIASLTMSAGGSEKIGN